ncbi:signal peptidase I [Dietzia sp. NPDC055343]
MTMDTTKQDETVAGATTARSGLRPRWGNTALNIGAIAGVVCMALAAASMLFGISPLIFRSGSMAPEITTGSLALAKTIGASEIRVGDIITINDERGTSITHRVVSISEAGGSAASVVLQGDANPVADPNPYVVTEVQRVFAHLPGIGYAAAWMSSKTAIFLAGLLAGALMMLAFGPSRTLGSPTRSKEPSYG